jgi:hypothetical protein
MLLLGLLGVLAWLGGGPGVLIYYDLACVAMCIWGWRCDMLRQNFFSIFS